MIVFKIGRRSSEVPLRTKTSLCDGPARIATERSFTGVEDGAMLPLLEKPLYPYAPGSIWTSSLKIRVTAIGKIKALIAVDTGALYKMRRFL
jgi:hypothetical protein